MEQFYFRTVMRPNYSLIQRLVHLNGAIYPSNADIKCGLLHSLQGLPYHLLKADLEVFYSSQLCVETQP